MSSLATRNPLKRYLYLLHFKRSLQFPRLVANCRIFSYIIKCSCHAPSNNSIVSYIVGVHHDIILAIEALFLTLYRCCCCSSNTLIGNTIDTVIEENSWISSCFPDNIIVTSIIWCSCYIMSYLFSNGFRLVIPYLDKIRSYVLGSWVGRQLLDVC